jgi:hypothetical protein
MRLAARTLPAADNTALYTVQAAHRAVFTASLCNRTAGVIKVRLALTDAGAAPTDADWIEYDTSLEALSVLERTGIALAGGQTLYARADVAGLSAVVYGIEEPI